MDNTLNLGRRVLSAAVATLTVLWAVGAAAFVVPQTANAAEAGDLIRGTSFPTVYYYGYDGSRYIFPNEKTYDSWFNGFAGVETLSDAAVAAIPPAGNVVYRPGSRWIKITTAAETYAVGRDGMIHWVETEDVATDFAGSDWNTLIDDVPDAFFDNYTEGVSLTDATIWDGAFFMEDGNYYVAWDGNAHMLTSAARAANAVEDRFFLDGAGLDSSSLDAGDDFTGAVCDLMDASQSGMCEDVVTPVGGDLMVSLASTTPASATVPDAANGFEATTWKFTADEATELSGLVLTYGGLAATTDLETVYLYEGDARLDDGRSINSSTRTATFAGLDIDFSAGQTRYITAVVDLSNAGNQGTFRLGLASATDVSTDGMATGSFPVWGNTHNIIDAGVGALTIDRNGSATATYSVGEQNAVIGRFSAAASTTEDMDVHSITVTVDDAKDHSDYELYQSGTMVATGTALGFDDLVLFSFDSDYRIEEGDTRNFEVRATVGGEATDVIKTYIRNSADVRATGLESGFGVDVTVTSYDGQTDCDSSLGADPDCTYVTIEGGSVTLAFIGPVAQDVREDKENHEFLAFSITSEEWAEVDSLSVRVVGTDLYDSAPALTDLRLVNADTGVLLSSTELDDNDDDDTVSFSDNFIVGAGETLNLAVTADLEEDVVAADDTFTVSLTAWTIENNDGDAITDVIPTSGITGKTQTAIASGLTVSLAGSPNGDKTVVAGAQDVLTTNFNFSAADGGDLTVTDLTLTVASDTADGDLDDEDDTDLLAEDYVAACSLYEGDTLVAGPESPDSSTGLAAGVDTIVFENFLWEIEGGQDSLLGVVCDFNDVTISTDEFAFIINDASTDIEVLDDEGETITAAGSEESSTGANLSASTKVSLTDGGSLVATVAADTPEESLLLVNSDDQAVSTFRFDANEEDFWVNDITLTEVGGGEEAVEMVTVEFPVDAEGTMDTRSKAMVGSTATFDNLGMYVEEGTAAYLYVYVDISNTDRDDGDATSNAYIEFELSDDTGEFEGRGVASSELDTDVIASATDTTAAERHVVRETIATIDSPYEGTTGALFNGNIPVFRFTVAASSTEDVVMDEFVLEVNGSGNWKNDCTGSGTWTENLAASAFTLNRINGASTTQLTDVTFDTKTSAFGDPAAAGCADTSDTDQQVKYVTAVFATDSGEVIPAGGERTFELKINVAGATENDSLQIAIPTDQSMEANATLTGQTDIGADFTATATTMTVESATGITVGTVITVDSEDMLVTGVSGTTMTVVRGYAGTTAAAHTDADATTDVDIRESSFLWQDDGTLDADDSSTLTSYWGSYLVNELDATGRTYVW